MGWICFQSAIYHYPGPYRQCQPNTCSIAVLHHWCCNHYSYSYFHFHSCYICYICCGNFSWHRSYGYCTYYRVGIFALASSYILIIRIDRLRQWLVLRQLVDLGVLFVIPALTLLLVPPLRVRYPAPRQTLPPPLPLFLFGLISDWVPWHLSFRYLPAQSL